MRLFGKRLSTLACKVERISDENGWRFGFCRVHFCFGFFCFVVEGRFCWGFWRKVVFL